jgi:hypothetical protein
MTAQAMYAPFECMDCCTGEEFVPAEDPSQIDEHQVQGVFSLLLLHLLIASHQLQCINTLLSYNFASDSNIVRSEHERNEACAATAGVGDIKYGKGEKKRAKRDLDHYEKMDQMFDCMLHQPVDLMSIVKEIQRNAVVPTATTPSVAPNSSPTSKYNRKFRKINGNIKILMEQWDLPRDSLKHMITSISVSRSKMRT